MTIKLRARCEDNHFVQVECWDLSGYYMLKELPPKWHWEVGEIRGVYETGFIAQSISPEDDQKLREWWGALPENRGWAGTMNLLHRGEESSLEAGTKIAKERHAIICDKVLDVWTRWDTDYGWREEDAVEQAQQVSG